MQPESSCRGARGHRKSTQKQRARRKAEQQERERKIDKEYSESHQHVGGEECANHVTWWSCLSHELQACLVVTRCHRLCTPFVFVRWRPAEETQPSPVLECASSCSGPLPQSGGGRRAWHQRRPLLAICARTRRTKRSSSQFTDPSPVGSGSHVE